MKDDQTNSNTFRRAQFANILEELTKVFIEWTAHSPHNSLVLFIITLTYYGHQLMVMVRLDFVRTVSHCRLFTDLESTR